MVRDIRKENSHHIFSVARKSKSFIFVMIEISNEPKERNNQVPLLEFAY